MRIEINKETTLESLELELLIVREELSKLQEENIVLAKQLKELMDSLIEKGIL
ncbi:MAG: hypothetical protein ACOYWZ_08215 [Bacillota bacterium]